MSDLELSVFNNKGDELLPFGDDLSPLDGSNLTYKVEWSNPSNEGVRNGLASTQIRVFADPDSPFTAGRILSTINSTGRGDISFTRKGHFHIIQQEKYCISEITDCPKTLVADLAFYLNFASDELVNATAGELHSFLHSLLHIGPQDTQFAIHMFVNDTTNVTDNYSSYYAQFKRRRKFLYYHIYIGDAIFKQSCEN